VRSPDGAKERSAHTDRCAYRGLVLHVQSEAVVARSFHPRNGQSFHTTFREYWRVGLRRHCSTCTVYDGRAESASPKKCTDKICYTVNRHATVTRWPLTTNGPRITAHWLIDWDFIGYIVPSKKMLQLKIQIYEKVENVTCWEYTIWNHSINHSSMWRSNGIDSVLEEINYILGIRLT